MATLHSFYLAPAEWQAPFTLVASEAHHLSRVLRLKAGALVRLFDGAGRQGLFEVRAVAKQSVSLEPAGAEALQRASSAFGPLPGVQEWASPRPSVSCTLASGFSKALRRSWFLEKAVELEAAAIWFWQGDYSQAALPDTEKETWRASLIAGAKQCESAWLPELSAISGGVEGLVARRGEFDRAYMLYEGDTGGSLLSKEALAAPGSVLLVVGPEGGFSPKEAQLLQKNDIVPVSLGSRILRWETAAVLALGLTWWARQEA